MKFLIGDPADIEIELRRSPRARRVSLRASRIEGKIWLTLPAGVSSERGLEFAREREAWLRGQLSEILKPIEIVDGVELPVRGISHRIYAKPSEKGAAKIDKDGALMLPGNAKTISTKALVWLKEQARADITTAADFYAAKLGVRYARIDLRDPRSRWGSCSASGRIMFSWRLIMAPSEVLNYVVAHEIAHLREMNHSGAFWALNKKLYGDIDPPQKWLKAHGAMLHRYRF